MFLCLGWWGVREGRGRSRGCVWRGLANGAQTVIPGFEYADHDFLTEEKFRTLVTAEQAEELGWLVRKA